jgi:hypothetical protein
MWVCVIFVGVSTGVSQHGDCVLDDYSPRVLVCLDIEYSLLVGN